MATCLIWRHQFLAIYPHMGARFGREWSLLRQFLTAFPHPLTIHLESDVFLFHISDTTPESSGHCEPRVLSPSNGFWLAPSANQNRRPKHAGVFRHLLARSWRSFVGRLPF